MYIYIYMKTDRTCLRGQRPQALVVTEVILVLNSSNGSNGSNTSNGTTHLSDDNYLSDTASWVFYVCLSNAAS